MFCYFRGCQICFNLYIFLSESESERKMETYFCTFACAFLNSGILMMIIPENKTFSFFYSSPTCIYYIHYIIYIFLCSFNQCFVFVFPFTMYLQHNRLEQMILDFEIFPHFPYFPPTKQGTRKGSGIFNLKKINTNNTNL